MVGHTVACDFSCLDLLSHDIRQHTQLLGMWVAIPASVEESASANSGLVGGIYMAAQVLQ